MVGFALSIASGRKEAPERVTMEPLGRKKGKKFDCPISPLASGSLPSIGKLDRLWLVRTSAFHFLPSRAREQVT
jgi:hypothetical protein